MANEKKRIENMKKVIQKAIELYCTNGVAKTSYKDIAEASSVASRSVQNYYPTKNDLVIAAYNEIIDILDNDIYNYTLTEEYSELSGIEQVSKLVYKSLNTVVTDENLISCIAEMEIYLQKENIDIPQKKYCDFIISLIKHALKKGMKDGTIRPEIENDDLFELTLPVYLRGIRKALYDIVCQKTDQESNKQDIDDIINYYIHSLKYSIGNVVEPINIINYNIDSTSDYNKKETILIADDEKINRVILYTILKSKYNILEACDGNEVISILQNNNVDLVLLDLMMPNMDGFGVLEKMNQLDLLKDKPVLIVTGFSDEVNQTKAMRMGASDVVIKPICPEVVLHRVENIIKKK